MKYALHRSQVFFQENPKFYLQERSNNLRKPQVLSFIDKKNSHSRNRSYIAPLKEESDHSQTFHAWKVQLFSLTAQEKISLLFCGFHFITVVCMRKFGSTYINISCFHGLWLYQIRIFNLNNALCAFPLLQILYEKKYQFSYG